MYKEAVMEKRKEAALHLNQLEDAIVRIETQEDVRKEDVLLALKAAYWLTREWLRSDAKK